jgi:uncharacterized RDD family membrane protein YckC
MSDASPGSLTAYRREGSLGAHQLIRSPEQVGLDFEIAGPMSRAMAFSIDYAVILVAEIVVFVALVFAAMSLMELEQLNTWVSEAQDGLARGELTGAPWMYAVLAVWIVLEFVLQFGYFVASELLMQGRSLGKKFVGLRVVRDGGLPVTLHESMVRNLLRVVDMLPASYFVGLVSMICSRQTRRLGDFGAGTLVIRESRGEPSRPLDLAREPGPGETVFRFDREQLAAIGPVERRLARQTLRRAADLGQRESERVLARAVAVLCARSDYRETIEPAEARGFLQALLRAAEPQ